MNFFDKSYEETLMELGSDFENGLSDLEAEKRLKRDGPNKLAEKKRKSAIKKFFAQFNDFMIIILLIAAAISFALGFINNENDYADPIIILVIVTMNALVGFIQESKAESQLNL